MSTLQTISVALIYPNPHRKLGTYPWIEHKIDALQRSIADVGMWESIIVRPVTDHFELAFGHHRMEAARRMDMEQVPVIVRDLTDEEMLKFMGRENGDDYSTQFLVMLNTWEGAVQYFRHDRVEKSQALDIAKVLGWIRLHGSGKGVTLSPVAAACAAAFALINGGHLVRENLEGLTVFAAREIVTRAQAYMLSVEKNAQTKKRPEAETKAAKKAIARGAKITASQVRKGEISQKNLRSQVDVNAFGAAAKSDRVAESPLFAAFGKALSKTIERMLQTDPAAEKLAEVREALTQITMADDHAIVRQINFDLGQLSARAANWQKQMIPTGEKVVGIKALENRPNDK